MKNGVSKHLKKSLAKNCSCYVLITCERPNTEGDMSVEMTYEGDAMLASYLLQGAQTIIDEQNNEDINQSRTISFSDIEDIEDRRRVKE